LRASLISAYGVTASVYEAAVGEGLTWHAHNQPHGHRVIRGRTRVEVEGQPAIEMTCTDDNKELPAGLRHQITAIEPDTVFVNIMGMGGVAGIAPGAPEQPPPNGGVLMADGTVVR
jgi:quercetin dioxygenase-like cupin family protein